MIVAISPCCQNVPCSSQVSKSTPLSPFRAASVCRSRATRHLHTLQQKGQRLQARGYRVEIQHDKGVAVLDVDEEDTILQAALDSGLDLSHDCKAGVCMTCPAKLLEGEVDQSAGMLDDGAKEQGLALLCISKPCSDCKIQIIEEDEVLEAMLCSSENV